MKYWQKLVSGSILTFVVFVILALVLTVWIGAIGTFSAFILSMGFYFLLRRQIKKSRHAQRQN